MLLTHVRRVGSGSNSVRTAGSGGSCLLHVAPPAKQPKCQKIPGAIVTHHYCVNIAAVRKVLLAVVVVAGKAERAVYSQVRRAQCLAF